MNRARTLSYRLLRAHGIGAIAGLLTLTACPSNQPGAAPNSQFAGLEEASNPTAVAGAPAPLSPEDVARVADATAENPDAALTAADAGGFSRYIAFGDSFSSGVGASNVRKLPCGQSDNAWPPLVYNALAIPSPFMFLACSGASTQDVAAVGKLQTGGYTSMSQLSELPPPDQLDGALITITIGGNDIKLDDSVGRCMGSSSSSTSSWSLSCLNLAQTLDNASAVVTDNLAPSLDYTFRAIRAAAPNATIVAVGYPHLVDATPACDSTLVGKLISRANRERMNNLADAINAQIRDAAANAGIASITDAVVDAFAGHEACSPQEWIVSGRSIFVDKNSGVAHPNDIGYRVYAQTVLNGLPPAPLARAAVATPSQPAAPASAPPIAGSAPASAPPIAGSAPAAKAPASAPGMTASAPAAKAPASPSAPSQSGSKPAQLSGSAGSKALTDGSAGSKADTLGSAGSKADALGSAGSKADTLGSAGALGSAGSNAEVGGSGGEPNITYGYGGSNAEVGGSGGEPNITYGYGGSNAEEAGYGDESSITYGYGGSNAEAYGAAGAAAEGDGSPSTEPPPADPGLPTEPPSLPAEPPPADLSPWTEPPADPNGPWTWPALPDDGFGDE